MSNLRNQVTLVTGCSSGIGRALTGELQRQGHRVFATARRKEALADLAATGVETASLDVNDPSSIQAAVDAIIDKAGRIDVLINNAGTNAFGPLLEQPLGDLRAVLETNVLGMVAMSQAVFPHMAEQKQGRLINIGSVAGLLPTPFAGGYCASKSAVHMISEVMRMEVEPFGIDVILVQPGRVKSNIAVNGSRDIERYRAPSSRYRNAYQGIVKRANTSQDNPMLTEDFARELVDQAFVTPPPRLIRLGAGADELPKLAELPGEQRDQVMATTYGLDALKG